MAGDRTVVVGIDSSTQSTKVVRVDAETGELLSLTSAPHPDGTAVEPERWWEALVAAGGTDLGGRRRDRGERPAARHGRARLLERTRLRCAALERHEERSAGRAPDRGTRSGHLGT